MVVSPVFCFGCLVQSTPLHLALISRPAGGLRHKLRVCAALQGQVLQFSTDPYGCRVIQKLLEVRSPGNKGVGDMMQRWPLQMLLDMLQDVNTALAGVSWCNACELSTVNRFAGGS